MFSRRLKIAVLVVLAAFAVAAVLFWLNLSRLTKKFAQEQIPGLNVSEVQVAWNRVKLSGFRYVSGNSVATIAAQSVDAHPTFLSFLQPEIEVRRLVIKSPEFRVLIKPQEEPPAGPRTGPVAPAPARADFKQVTVVSGRGEIEDRTVSGQPARLNLDQVEVLLDNLKYPVVAGSTAIEASCVIKGQPDGHAHVSGWIDAVNRSAELRLETTTLDLENLRPYLHDRVQTIANSKGTVDLRLEILMTKGVYQASGELTLADLHIPTEDRAQPRLSTLLLTQYLKLRGNRVAVPFKLTGDLKKKEHRLDLSALLSGMINQEIGNEALQKKIGLPKNLDQDLQKLKERAKELRKLF